MPRSTTTPQRAERTLLQRLFTRRAAVPVLVVIAVLPWLVPWHQLFAAGDPAALPSGSSTSQAGAATPEREGPDERSVKALASRVAGARGHDVPVSPEEVAGVSTRPGPYVKLGRLQIPTIGVDTQYGEGVFEKTLVKGPGHWPGTPMPGRSGNAVISGHRNTQTQPFKRINELRPGDTIIITHGDQKPVTFVVRDTEIVPEAEYKEYVLEQPDSKSSRPVTLFACHPEGNPIYRLVGRAEVE